MEKILIIQTAFIGDAILTLPMLQKLRDFYQDAVIDVIAIPSTAEIFLASPAVNSVIILDKKFEHKSLFSLLKFSKEIKRKNYTMIYSPHRSLRSSLIVMLSGVRDTYGFDNSSLKHVYKNLISYIDDKHEVQRNLDLIGYNYSGDGWKMNPCISIDDHIRRKIDIFLNNINFAGNILAVAPGSVWNTKIYPEEYLRKIIQYLVSHDYKIILIGGEKDKILCNRIASEFNERVYSSAGDFNLTESVEILKRCLMLISNDSAPTHLGICADVPVLTIYCSTVPEFGFYPYNKKSSFVSYNDLDCKPCGIHGYNECPLGHFACGRNLLPEVVLNKINTMLNVY